MLLTHLLPQSHYWRPGRLPVAFSVVKNSFMAHPYTHTHTHTHTNAHTRTTHTHANTHNHTHANTHTITHMQTHTHSLTLFTHTHCSCRNCGANVASRRTAGGLSGHGLQLHSTPLVLGRLHQHAGSVCAAHDQRD